MKTKHINSFEIAVVSMIVVGFILIGFTVFFSLTPRQQSNLAGAFQMFDIHEETAAGFENFKFIINIPNEFNKQFYKSFTEIATLPSETFDVPRQIASEFSRNITSAINNLSNQVAMGYSNQTQAHEQTAELAQLNPQGKVMGAMIDLTDKFSSAAVVEQKVPPSLNMHYDYQPPKFEDFKLALESLNP
jgi:hypothetical protein